MIIARIVAWIERHPLATAMAAAAVAQMILAFLGVTPILAGRLVDADCYSRLARVLQLHIGGVWWDRVDPHINAPYGETLQWTRPLDILLELGAEPLGLVIPFRQALFWWGALISPFLLLATLAVLWWGLKSRLPVRRFLLLVGLFHLSPSLISTFLLGFADHHSLLALLFISQLMLLLKGIDGGGTRLSAVNGLVGGLALWVSLESAVPQAFFGAVLVGLWLSGRVGIGQIVAYVTLLFAAGLLAIFVELPPEQWLVPAYDRISIVHVALLGVTALGWAVLGRWQPYTPARRWLVIVPGTLALAAASIVMFPKLFAGPFVDHGEVGRAWLASVSEWQPLWPNNRGRAAQMFIELGSAVVVVPWLMHRRRDPVALAFLGGIVLFGAAALSAVRWASYAQAALLLPWTEAVAALAAQSRWPMPRLAAALGIGLGFLFAVPLAPAGQATPREAAAGACPVAALGDHMATMALSRRRPIVMTYLFIGPELEWRSGFDVVGIPSANAVTITDTEQVLGATEDQWAKAGLKRRHIDYVLICPSSGWADDYRNSSGDTLHQRLERGEVPPWLETVPLPAALQGFRLFRVRLERD